MGCRQVGKSTDFDSVIPRFESWHPIQFKKPPRGGFFISDIRYLEIGNQISECSLDHASLIPENYRPIMILMNDFQAQWAELQKPFQETFQKVGSSGWYILGQEVKNFETSLAKAWPVQHAVGVANGLDALEIALRVTGISPGDKVLTTPLSAFATTLAILRAGGKPVFIDTDESGLIDLDLAERTLSENPDIRYMIPVHLFGACLDMQKLKRLKDKFSLTLIEDCAQSILAADRGVACGTVGQIACTSFYPTKNLGAFGDGGALLTSSSELADHAKSLRDYGQTAKYQHTKLGMNSRLDELQAALLNDVLLPRLRAFTGKRLKVASRYLNEIKNPGIQMLDSAKHASSVWHLFPVFIKKEHRASFQNHLRDQGVQSGIHYPGLISDQAALDKSKTPYEIVGTLNVARKLTETEVSLPIHPFLTDLEIQQVIQACQSWSTT